MRVKNKNENINSFNIIIFSLFYCFISILLLLITDLWVLRVITIFFFFFFLGYPISLLIKNLDSFERIAVSFGLSNLIMLFIYYMYYILSYCFNITPTFEFNILLIGIFSISSNLVLLIYFRAKKSVYLQISFQKIINSIKKYYFLIIILVIGVCLRFLFLDAPDLTTDEVLTVNISYPIIDPFNMTGAPPPPFLYLNFHHSPMCNVGANIVMNILNPHGWLYMRDWMAKFFFAFIGSFSIFSIFSLLNKVYGKFSGYIGALFYSISTYAIIVSKIGYQEIFLIVFLIITMEFTYREKWKLVGLFLGLSLLAKFTALTIIPSVLLYLLIRNFRPNWSFKKLLINFSFLAFFAMLLYLPILIANISTFFQYGYADTFISRVFGLKDPNSETVGEPEIPIGLFPGMLRYSPLISVQLINVIGPILIPFIIFCFILSFSDKPKILGFNIFCYSYFIIFYLIFTSRWFQIISLSPLIIPIIVISCRIVNLDKFFSKLNIFLDKSYPIISLKFKPYILKLKAQTKNIPVTIKNMRDFYRKGYLKLNPYRRKLKRYTPNVIFKILREFYLKLKVFIRRIENYIINFKFPAKFRYKSLKKLHKTHKIKYHHFAICSILIYFLCFSFFYSWYTISYPHQFSDSSFDDLTETFRTNWIYSTVGYLWIMRTGYDQVMEIVRIFKFYSIYVDDIHPIISYYYYFYSRGITSLVSDWDNRTNSLFIFYKSPNYFWEPFSQSRKGYTNEQYIITNGRCIWDSINFEIYIYDK